MGSEVCDEIKVSEVVFVQIIGSIPTRSVFLTKAKFKSEVWPKDAESAKVCIPCRQSGFWTKRWMFQKDSI